MRGAMSRCFLSCLLAGALALSGCRSQSAPETDAVRIEHAPNEAPLTAAATTPAAPPAIVNDPERVESGALDAGTLLAPAWGATGAMHVARQNHAAALLQSGLVLVAGGHPGNNIPTATAETYNPSTQTWTTVGSMTSARRLFGACTLASGKVLVAGGNAGAGDVTSADLFDPTHNTWSATGHLATAREDFSMTCLADGRVLVAGGSTSSGIVSSSEVYSPTSGTWMSRVA